MKTKKNLAARIRDAIFPPKKQSRHYAAARLNRQNADWTTYPTSANWELRQSLRPLRARAREAARNDPHLSRYLELIRSNVVGVNGITLQSRAMKLDGTLDLKVNQLVEEAWWLWGHRETCTVSGKLDWKGVQDLVATQIECDGEALVQMIAADNPFGFALKVINVDYLDEYYNDTTSNGNRIIMSVEYDANDRPVAYWLTTPASDIMFTVRRERHRTRIPAEQMIHIFEPHDDEAQGRGVTAFKAVLLTARNFHAYKAGVIQSARFASNLLGFFKNTVADDSLPYTGADDKEGVPRFPEIDISPMAMNELPPGYEFDQLDPKQPTQNHSEFAKTILMEMAAGLGIPYFLLANDWEATNFSSSRGGLDAARDMWRKKAEFIANTLCRRVFHEWARSAMLNGQLTLTARQFNEIQNPKWASRGFKYIDPTKDINADVTALENKLTTWTDILAEQGKDFTEHLKRLKSEQDQAKAMGIDLVAVSTVKVADTGTAPPDDSGPPPKDTKTPPKRGYLNGESHEDQLLN